MNVFRIWIVFPVLLFVFSASSVGFGRVQPADHKSATNNFPLKITISKVVVSDDKTNIRVIGELQNAERHLFLLSCKSVLAIMHQHFDPELLPDGKTYEVKDGTGDSWGFPLDCAGNQEYKILMPGEAIKFDQILMLIDNPDRPFFSSGAKFELHLLYTGGDPSSKQKLTYWKGNLTSNSIFFRLSGENSKK